MSLLLNQLRTAASALVLWAATGSAYVVERVAASEPEPVDGLIRKLDAESFQERSAARRTLVERLHDPSDPGLTELLAARYATSPEIRDQANQALREIFALQVLGTGRRDCGVTWIYWLDRNHGRSAAHPFVRSMEPNSFLAQGGLKVGDVVTSAADRTFNKRGSVAELSALLEKAPTGTPLSLTVMRGDPRKLTKDRVKTLTINVTPVNTAKTEGRAEQPGEYNAWLKSLGKSGTVPNDNPR